MKKPITKISFIVIMLCVVILAVNCKKDDTTTTQPNNNNPIENTTNYAIYEGIKIPFSNSVVIKVEDFFYQQGNVNEFNVCLTSQTVKYNVTHDVFEGTGSGVIISFLSKNKTYFQATDYTVNVQSGPIIQGTFKLNYHVNRNFFMGSGGQNIYCISGTGSVTLNINTYEIILDCKTSDNKDIMVYYKGNLNMYISDHTVMVK
jgi:hypothetical protein